MTDPKILQQVYFDNVRANQIGGETDGISHNVAEDLGYSAIDDVLRLSSQLAEEMLAGSTPQQQKVAKTAGRVICGDCGQVTPCAHVGQGRTKGY